MFDNPNRLDSRRLFDVKERGSVLFSKESEEATRVRQQRCLPDQRYGVNNFKQLMPEYYTGTHMDITEAYSKPRPLEAAGPYIPIGHILEQQPALNLFDVDPLRPDLYEGMNDRYGPANDLMVHPNDLQEREWQMQRAKAFQLVRSRGAWNSYKQLEFIYRNRALDPQLMLYKDELWPLDKKERASRHKERGTFLRDRMGRR